MKLAANGARALSVHEELIYEIWLLDTEARNGGLSQYFCNRGLGQWQRCVAAASSDAIPSFFPFAERVAAFLRINPDPYLAIVSGGREAEDLYYEHQTAIVRDLRTAVESTL